MAKVRGRILGGLGGAGAGLALVGLGVWLGLQWGGGSGIGGPVPFTSSFDPPSEVSQLQVVDADCDPSQNPCRALGAAGTLTLALGDGRGVATLSPFAIEVQLDPNPEGRGATAVAVAFTMEGMYMGDNRFALTRGLEAPHTWRGEGILPFCSWQRRQWRATVWWQDPAASYHRADFTLEISDHSS
ncbi:MAG: hypothetical protein ACFCBW_18700 [Candidatus Competibacterales bacterium]